MTLKVPYTVSGTIGDIELRSYPALVLASVSDPGDDSGFMHLFRYITGSNRTKERVPMTAPVITAGQVPATAPVAKGEKIPMTAPVITSGQIRMTGPGATGVKIPMTAPVVSDSGSMSFVMPAGRAEPDLPEPVDSRVRLVTVPAREVAVLRFRGTAGKDAVKDAASRLLAAVAAAGFRTRGEVFLMRYNPPWTPGLLRRNEAAVEIDR